MKLVEQEGTKGTAELDGVRREVDLSLVEEAKVGDYVLMHVGFAIQVIDETTAAETLQEFQEFFIQSEKQATSGG
jgi:hydrogenase expression/formation protein HypC